jgi:hypothetical protein
VSEDSSQPANPAASWLSTRQRLIVAVVALVVVAIMLTIVNQLIKTHTTTHSTYNNVTNVNIKVGNGSLRLINTAGNTVDVERKVVYTLHGPSLTQKVQGNTLLIQQNCSGLHIGECDTSYVISVPNKVVTTIVSSGGAVDVDGLQGQVTARTSGGKIDVNQTFGNLDLKTDSGEISGQDLSSLQVMSQTKGGKVNLDFAAAPTKVDASSTDGTIDVAVPKGNTAYNVNAGSTNGKSTIDVKNDTESPRSITARSVDGKVTVETN